MLGIDVVYIIVNLILLSVFYLVGGKISKGENWAENAIMCVIAFTLILGLRYGRGNDYFHYVDIYEYGYNEGQQLVFTWINGFLKLLGVGRYSFFLFYSFMEILCAMFFLKRYKKYAQYILPLFLIATIVFNEYQIRQALGFSFVLLCLDALFGIHHMKKVSLTSINREKLALVILYFTLAYSIHSACGYMLIIMILIYFLYQRTIPLKISIPVLLLATYFFSEWFDYSWLNPMLTQFVEDDERMSIYIENSDKWFSSEGMEEKYTRNPIVLVAEMAGTISLYILGSKVINKYVHRADACTMYNFFVIGSILQNAFRQLELLNRIGGDFAMFWFFPLSLVLYYRKDLLGIRFYIKDMSGQLSYIKRLAHNKKIYKVLMVCLLWYAYDYLKYLFMRGDMTLFIWDMK